MRCDKCNKNIGLFEAVKAFFKCKPRYVDQQRCLKCLGLLVALLLFVGCTHTDNLTSNNDSVLSVNHVELIASNLASEQEYRKDYNCDEFSMELVRRLNNAGYNSTYCVGDFLSCNASEKNCWHAWVKTEVFIEAINGKILSSQEFQENYNLSHCKEVK